MRVGTVAPVRANNGKAESLDHGDEIAEIDRAIGRLQELGVEFGGLGHGRAQNGMSASSSQDEDCASGRDSS